MGVVKGQRQKFLPEVLRLKAAGLTRREIADQTGLPYSTVVHYLKGTAKPAAPEKPVDVAQDATDVAGLSPLEAAILRNGDTWAGRAEIAKAHRVPMGVVLARFHRLRVAA